MKKWMCVLTSVVLVLLLCACGAEETDMEQAITRAAQETRPEAEAMPADFVFVTADREWVPGREATEDTLPQANMVYEVPSCAIEGKDIIYQYDSFEITVLDDGVSPILYSIYLLEGAQTTEGLAIGDTMEKAETLYGQPQEVNANSHIYFAETTQLIFLTENGTIAGIEYRMRSL